MLDEWSRWTDSRFEEFATGRSADGDIDHVGVFGASYANGPYRVNVEYLNSDDYLTKVGLVGSHAFTLADNNKLTLTAGLHRSRDAGDLSVTASEGGELDDGDIPGAIPGVTRRDNGGRRAYLDARWDLGNVSLAARSRNSTAHGSRTTSPATTA